MSGRKKPRLETVDEIAERIKREHAEDRRRAAERRREIARSEVTDPMEMRAQRGEIKPVRITIGHTTLIDAKTGKVKGVRREEQQGWMTEADARIMRRLTLNQQRAAQRIVQGRAILVSGVRGGNISIEALAGLRTGNPTTGDGPIAPVVEYVNWCKECFREKLNPNIVVDIFCLGVPVTELAARHRRDHRTILGLAALSLDVFCRMKGWPDERQEQRAG